MSLTHIETIELGSSQSSITFSSIPQDYDDLVLKLSIRSDRSSNLDPIVLELNGSTSNRSAIQLRGDGSNAASLSYTNGRIGFAVADSVTANTFGNFEMYVSNYTASQAKSISIDHVAENNATEAYQTLVAFLWNDTSAITSIEFSSLNAANWMTNSTASLYGVTAGGDGTVTTS